MAKERFPKREIRQPDDFGDVESFLKFMRETFADDCDFDEHNRLEAEEDAAFVAGRQWDEQLLEKRHSAKKPTLQFNRLPAFVGQVIGNRRLNETVIKVVPDNGGTREIAAIREGLIRNIQKNSKAERAYDKALENQVIGGIGNFQVTLDFASDDVFEQDIAIRQIPDPFAVVWDRLSVDPTGADARHCFVVDSIPLEDFKKRFPDAQTTGFPVNESHDAHTARAYNWFGKDDVRVVSFWRMRSVERTLALLNTDSGDTSVEDVTDLPVEEWFDRVVVNADGRPTVRVAPRSFAEMYLASGADLLDGPYRLPIKRVPVFRVPGWEINVADERVRFGLVRFLKDPIRLHNFWRSVIAERLMMQPKAKWLASDRAVEGRESEYRNAHLRDDPLLVWNAEAGAPPQFTEPSPIEPGLVQEASMTVDDIREIANLHEASLGMNGNEVSGRAIIARQRVGEIGFNIFEDNLNASIAEAGSVINDLIPIAYDTVRVVKVNAPQSGDETFVRINQSPETDITSGKYQITLSTGPSFVTKRVEAAEAMLAMVNAMPQTLSVVADKIIEAQDWPGAEEIARRLRLTLPPGIVKESEKTEEQIANEQQQAQAAQEQAQMQNALAQAELRERLARATEAEARAQQAQAVAARQLAEIEQIRNVDAQTKTINAQVGAVESLARASQANAIAQRQLTGIETDKAETVNRILNDQVSRVSKLFGDNNV